MGQILLMAERSIRRRCTYVNDILNKIKILFDLPQQIARRLALRGILVIQTLLLGLRKKPKQYRILIKFITYFRKKQQKPAITNWFRGLPWIVSD